jgi:hemerythrin superfamily protein
MSIMTAMGLSSDATELLKTDHRAVDAMIATLEGYADENSSSDAGFETFNQMKESLTLHAMAEEQIFYPALKSHPETAPLVPEAYEEHQELKDLLNQMTALAPHTSEFQHLLATLKGDIVHHVVEEEQEMFVKAKQALGETRLQELGKQIQEFKDREQPNVRAQSARM